MTEQYRGSLRRCPQCSEPLTAQITKMAELDWCHECGGVFVDWMDGTLQELSLKLEPPTAPTAAPPLRTGEDVTCPACREQMTMELGVGAQRMLRCPGCVGCFVPRAAWNEMGKGLDDDKDEPNSEPFLTRVLDRVSSLLLGK